MNLAVNNSSSQTFLVSSWYGVVHSLVRRGDEPEKDELIIFPDLEALKYIQHML